MDRYFRITKVWSNRELEKNGHYFHWKVIYLSAGMISINKTKYIRNI